MRAGWLVTGDRAYRYPIREFSAAGFVQSSVFEAGFMICRGSDKR